MNVYMHSQSPLTHALLPPPPSLGEGWGGGWPRTRLSVASTEPAPSLTLPRSGGGDLNGAFTHG
jgi:hypothetical protein